jgi:hypothetical protein
MPHFHGVFSACSSEISNAWLMAGDKMKCSLPSNGLNVDLPALKNASSPLNTAEKSCELYNAETDRREGNFIEESLLEYFIFTVFYLFEYLFVLHMVFLEIMAEGFRVCFFMKSMLIFGAIPKTSHIQI